MTDQKALEEYTGFTEEEVKALCRRFHMNFSETSSWYDGYALKNFQHIREFPTGKGFADVVFLPLPHTAKPALVVELKYDKTAGTALQQIKDRHYTQAIEGYSGEILLVGISYNRDHKDKPHSCVIEKIEVS